jgi:uncharacterized cupredoxin-like copper-binding protein
MSKHVGFSTFARLLAALTIAAGLFGTARAHKDHGTFSAGEPGDPKKPSRVIEVTMSESAGKMTFKPSKLVINRGEQIRFKIKNIGLLPHEFLLATTEENLKHAEDMKKYPDMEHDDPNGIRLEPGKSGELVWRFTKKGEFEYGCLIPGHREAGMTGLIIVK